MSNHVTTRTQEEIAALFTQDLVTGVGRSVKHDSAPKHVSGEAVYVDDRLEFPACPPAARVRLLPDSASRRPALDIGAVMWPTARSSSSASR